MLVTFHISSFGRIQKLILYIISETVACIMLYIDKMCAHANISTFSISVTLFWYQQSFAVKELQYSSYFSSKNTLPLSVQEIPYPLHEEARITLPYEQSALYYVEWNAHWRKRVLHYEAFALYTNRMCVYWYQINKMLNINW